MLRDDLYPIKVDSVRRTAVLDENNEIRVGVAEGFGQENEATVAKIAWLSKKDVPKAYGSMVVYLTKATDARRLLAEGFFYAGGESGCTGVFERRPRPDQCYRCQEIGHKAFQCIAGKDLDKSLRLFVNIELLGVVRSRSVEYLEPHHASADRKSRYESPLGLTSKHFACIPCQLH